MKTNRKLTQNSASGFTLIEIAIVLVIISLLLGGVMKGQTLIANAKFNSWANEIEAYRTAVLTFESTYKGLPGDLKNASTRLTGPAGMTITNGNGNGQIQGGGSSAATSESGAAFQHLILADLIKGDPTQADFKKATPVGGTYNAISTGNWANGKLSTKLLMYNVPGELCQRLDEEYDDGIATSGDIARYQGSEWDKTRVNNIFVEL